MKKILTIAVTAITMCSALASPFSSDFSCNNSTSMSIIQIVDTHAAGGRLYCQNDKCWNSNLRSAGCGLFSMANAVYALNGQKMDINSFADWAKSKGYWNPGGGGTYRDSLYGNVTAKYGSQYGFKVNSKQYGTISDSKLINHLKNGGVAVAHVGKAGVNGHFIAITGYSNGKYHIIDSVNRCAGSGGDAWQTAAFMSSTSKNCSTRVDWYCLISKSGTSTNSGSVQNGSTSLGCFKKYTGSSGSIVTALNAIGENSSYNYRKKIAEVNGISGYSGTAAQNTAMLKKLKAGTLKKPGSTQTSSAKTVTYFKKYTGSSGSIVTALNAISENSSYDYRKKIAVANGISNYSGTASQNTTMLNKLKAGNLIKP